jgi:hypothetical protein
MKKYIHIIFFSISLLSTFISYSQEIIKQKYTTGFIFKKGIYLTFENFKDNNPIPASDIVSKFDDQSSDFFRRVISNKKFSYITKDHDTSEITSKDTWGYSDGINVYIQPKQITIVTLGEISKEFYKYLAPERMILIGTYCVFKDQRKAYQNDYLKGSYYESPNTTNNIPSKYIANCIMDFNTGEIKELTSENVREILKSDPELYTQYKNSKLKARPKNYVFIMKYNERHPIYFPVADFK